MNHDFEELYERFFKDVYLFVLAMSKDPHLADDITQETFFKALRELKHFRGDCSVKSWLCQIAKNLYISYTRKKKTVPYEEMETFSSGSDIESQYIQTEDAISVYRVLHLLEEPYKEVFVLRVLGDLSYREIGDIFNRPENWVRVTYYRAKKKIQDALSGEPPASQGKKKEGKHE